jgi:outer membrane protein TolC
MRWKFLGFTVALLLLVSSGCKQRIFMTEQDYQHTVTSTLEGQELNPDLSTTPMINPSGTPMTLRNLDRKVRFISLAECIAIGLEQGRVGQPSLLFPGTAQDNLVQFTGRGVAGSDSIRVLALDPARAGAEIEGALSKFDAVIRTSMQWSNTDQPIGTAQQNFLAGGGGIDVIQSNAANFSTALLKPLPTGGVAGITFNLPYEFTNLPARVNPSYRPQLQFSFEQPLLQGYGVEINQLRTAHPGSIINPGVLNTAPTAEGILISRIRFDQQRAEFERLVNQMLLNIETAYWNLYGAYWALYSREQGLQFAYTAFRLSKAKLEAGKISAADFYQSKGQYELFKAQRFQAIERVFEFERQLRGLLGMPVDDGTRLMPSDSPTLAPYTPDWSTALQEALTKRPELYMARQDIKAAQMNLILAKNQLLPDVRFTANYDFQGLGSQLDGGSGATTTGGAQNINAFRDLADGRFSSWSAGIQAVVPLGFRFGNVQVRQAQLALTRAMEVLKDQELKAEHFLYNYYHRLDTAYERIRANRATREAYGEQLRVRQLEYDAGRGTLDLLLESQRFWAEALASEYQAIVDYNNALVGFEFAKGTIMQHDNIFIAEGELPACASVRAVEHEKARTTSLVLREHAKPVLPVAYQPKGSPMPASGMSLPSVMSSSAPFLKEAPKLPATPDVKELPTPVPLKPEEVFPKELPTATTPVVPRSQPMGVSNRRESDFGTAREPR